MKRLKTAILGCGGFAAQHAKNLKSLQDDLHLAAFCDIQKNRAVKFAEFYGEKEARVYDDHHELFDEIDLDLLVIVLPPFAHTDEVALAAERGIHILIEKPIALTSEKAWAMVDVVENSGIKTQVGFMYRFGSAVQRVKELVDTRRAGEIALIRAGYFCNHLHAPWWRFKDRSGGQVFEQAIHLVDLCQYLGGEIDSVYSVQKNLFHQEVPGGYTVEDTSATVFNYQNGGIGVLTATNNAIPWKWLWDLKMVTRNLVVDFQDSNQAIITYTDVDSPSPETQYETETIKNQQDDYMMEMVDLLKAIRTGSNTRTPMRHGAQTLEIVLAAAKSAESGEVAYTNKGSKLG